MYSLIRAIIRQEEYLAYKKREALHMQERLARERGKQ